MTLKGRSLPFTPSPSWLFGERLGFPPQACTTTAATAGGERGQHGAVAAAERAQLDVDDVVLEATAVREAGEVAGEGRQAVALADGRGRRDAGVEPDQVGLRRAGEVQAGHAREQDRARSLAIARGALSSTG